MSTVAEIYRHTRPNILTNKHPEVHSTTRVGIEIEWEGVHTDQPVPQGWNMIPDGSLRNNGVELVFSSPAGGRALFGRLNKLRRWVEKSKITPQITSRTSVHVHVDVRDLEWEQLWRMIILYVITEPYLFSLCGPTRCNNIYSLSYGKGQAQLRYLKDFRSEDGIRHTGRERLPKYAALNLQALSTFGSLEFRGHEGTDDFDRIQLWTNHLLCLKSFAVNSEIDPEDYPGHMSAIGAEEFLRSVFGEYLQSVGHDLENEVFQGAWIAEDVLFHDRMSTIANDSDFFGVTSPEESSLVKAFGGVYKRPAPRKRSHPLDSYRVLLSSSTAAMFMRTSPEVNVRRDSTITAIDAARKLIETFGPSTDISTDREGLGRIGRVYNIESPLEGTEEYRRGVRRTMNFEVSLDEFLGEDSEGS